MKNIAFAFSIFSILFFTACEKDEPSPVTPPPPYEEPEPEDTITLQPFIFVPGDTTDGFVQGIWQDSFLWEASCEVYWQTSHPTEPEKYVSLSITTYGMTFGILRQGLSFNEIPRHSTGTYLIGNNRNDYDDGFVGVRLATFGDDGDVLESIYEVDETATDNKITITQIDTLEHVYHGKFTVSLKQEWGLNTPYSPNFVKIKDVEFWAK